MHLALPRSHACPHTRIARKVGGAAKGRAMVDVPKLEDAELAGSADSASCTLIVTEGDSAKALAVAGLEVVGRQRWARLTLDLDCPRPRLHACTR